MNRTIDVLFRLRLDSAADAAVAASFTKLRSNLKSAKVDARSLTEEMRKLMLAEQDAGNAGGGAGGGGVGGGSGSSKIIGLGRVASSLGDRALGGDIRGIGQLTRVPMLINDLTEALGPVGVVAPIAAGGLIGMQLGMQLLTEYLKPATEALNVAVAGVKTYYEAIQKGTTESIAKQKEDAEDKLRAEQETYDLLSQQRQKAFDALVAKGGSDPLADLQARVIFGIGGLTGGLNGLNTQIDDSAKAVTDLTGTVEALGRASDDAIVKLRSENEARNKIALAASDAVFKKNQDEHAAMTMSAKAIQDKIDANKHEVESILKAKRELMSDAASPTQDVSDKLDAFKNRLKELGEQTQFYTNVALPAAKATEDTAAAMKKFGDDMEAAAKTLTEINKLEAGRTAQLAARAQADARQVITDSFSQRIAAAKASDDAINAYNEQQSQIQKIQDDYAKRSADTEKSYQTDSLKALQAYLLSEQRATDAYAKQRRRTLEDLNDNLIDLAASGDVAGFIQAQKAGEKELKRQTEDADDAAKQRAEDFANQNRERRDQADKELRDLKEENQDKLQEQQEGHQKRVETAKALEDEFARQRLEWQRQDEQARRNAEDADFASKLAEYQTQLGKQTATIRTFFDNAYAYAQGIVTRVTALFTGSTPTPQSNQGHLGGITPLASGIDRVPSGGMMALLHPNEAVLNSSAASQWRAGASGGGGLNIGSITIGPGNNVTKSDVQSAVMDLYSYIRDQMSQQIT